MPAPDLHTETVDFGGGTCADLQPDRVGVCSSRDGGRTRNWVYFVPETRQEANRMSIALKKAARRLQEIGSGLPDGE